MLDRSTGATTVVEHESGLSMLEDRSGNLWLDSNVGLEKMDSGGKVHKVPVSLSSSVGGPEPVEVNYLYEDSEGILWLATETGLVRLDPKTDGRPDPRPAVRESAPVLGDLSADFDFSHGPRPPVLLPVHPAAGPASR